MRYELLVVLLTVLLGMGPAMPARASAPPSAGDVDPPARKEDETSYSLSAAYPNPFRTQTQFGLRVNETQQVSIEVYNILGQRVRILYEGVLRKGERRSFTFRARDLPSGLYLCRIRGETFTAAQRVTLIR